MKVVIDVNIWVSALLWGGVPGQVLRLVYEQTIEGYVSTELLQELEATLRRAKFQSRLEKRQQTVAGLMAIATALCPSVPIDDIEIPDLRDPDDAKIVATAIAASAEILITGDQDLLVLQNVQGIRMVTPTQFLDLL
ncbi:MAG: putative toxin-antitoxin system toxin component, PIN family [Cyanobacteria bacterium P01_D01_bin.56]